MAKIETIPLLSVTKGSSDGTVREGDRVWYSKDGALCLAGPDGGFITKDELTNEITDFDYVIDDKYEVAIINGREFVVRKNEEGIH